MERKKFDILNVFLDKIIFGFFIGLLSLTLNFAFSQNSFAEYKATLSASISESTASIDGTEIIESSDETAEHEINLKINTTNKTGYTATISAKTEETALLNTNPAIILKLIQFLPLILLLIFQQILGGIGLMIMLILAQSRHNPLQ